MIQPAPGLTGEYLGVHLVRVRVIDGSVQSVAVAEDIKLELDDKGNMISRPTQIVPVVVVIGGSAWVAPGPSGEVY